MYLLPLVDGSRLRRIVVGVEGAVEAGEERREVLEGLVGLWVVEEGHYLLFTRLSEEGELESGWKPGGEAGVDEIH
jgi:hypothetical protein